MEFWYLLPISILIATIAMSSGIEGATFFAPLFIIGLSLDPEIAIGAALVTQTFGFASGIIAFGKKKIIDYRLGFTMLSVTIPASLVGVWASGQIDSTIIMGILGTALLVVSISLLLNPEDMSVLSDADERGVVRKLITSDGEEINYKICHREEGALAGGVGALFLGMVSTGLGVLNNYVLLQRCRVPVRVSIATNVFIIAVTTLVASIGHVYQLSDIQDNELMRIIEITAWTVPGVIIGGQLGPMIVNKISKKILKKAVSILFILVGLVMFAQLIFGTQV